MPDLNTNITVDVDKNQIIKVFSNTCGLAVSYAAAK